MADWILLAVVAAFVLGLWAGILWPPEDVDDE